MDGEIMAAAAPAKRPSIPASTTTTISSISKDDLLEIFLRLPDLPALVRAALTCRSWLRAVRSSPSFRRLFRALHPAPLLGLFLDPFGTEIPTFAPARRSDPAVAAAVRRGDFFLTSLPHKDDSCPAWQVADCRQGHVLLWNLLDWTQVAVLNPVTWAVHFLPMPLDDIFAESGDEYNFDGFHLLCSDEKPSSFRVLCVCGDVSSVRAAVFSSETWELVVHPRVVIGADRRLRFRSGMLVDGSVYWPYNWLASNGGGGDEGEGYVVKLDTVTMGFSFVDLPLKVQGYNFRIGDTEEDGEICIVYALDSLLHVWIRRADDDGIERWVPQKTLSLIEDIGWITETWRGVYFGLEVLEVRAGQVYMATKHSFPHDQSCRWFFSLSLDTMEIERLFQGRSDCQAYPYVMAWPPCLVGDDGSIVHEAEGSESSVQWAVVTYEEMSDNNS